MLSFRHTKQTCRNVADTTFNLVLFSLLFALNTRSSWRKVLCKKDVLKNFAKFKGRHLCQSLFFNKVAGWGISIFLWILRNLYELFFYRTPPVPASETHSLYLLSPLFSLNMYSPAGTILAANKWINKCSKSTN